MIGGGASYLDHVAGGVSVPRVAVMMGSSLLFAAPLTGWAIPIGIDWWTQTPTTKLRRCLPVEGGEMAGLSQIQRNSTVRWFRILCVTLASCTRSAASDERLVTLEAAPTSPASPCKNPEEGSFGPCALRRPRSKPHGHLVIRADTGKEVRGHALYP